MAIVTAKSHRLLFFLTLLAVGFSSQRIFAQSKYQITTFDFPGALGTYPSGINERGEIVGYYAISGTDNLQVFRGFKRNPGGLITDITPPQNNGGSSFARGINADGLIAGEYTDAGNTTHAYLSEGSHYWNADLQGYSTNLFGISNNDLLVGLYSPDPENLPTSFLHYPNGTLVTILFPGSTFSWPEAVNNEAVVVGVFGTAAGGLEGFAFSQAVGYQQLAAPGANGTYPYGINDHGVIVGDYYVNGRYVGFVMYGEKYEPIFIKNSNSTYPTGINLKNTITGYYWDEQLVSHGFVATLE